MSKYANNVTDIEALATLKGWTGCTVKDDVLFIHISIMPGFARCVGGQLSIRTVVFCEWGGKCTPCNQVADQAVRGGMNSSTTAHDCVGWTHWLHNKGSHMRTIRVLRHHLHHTQRFPGPI